VEALQVKNNLRVLRAERNWTQADLAEQLQVSRQTVNAVETEKYEPSLTLAFKIAKLFEKRVEDIFEPPRTDGQPVG
jgi:putative transcriptional regulator